MPEKYQNIMEDIKSGFTLPGFWYKGEKGMKYAYLTEKERYQIEAWLVVRMPVREIAARLGRCRATVYNEIKRGTVELVDSKYLCPYRKYCADAGQRKMLDAGKNKGVALKAADNSQLLSYLSYLVVDLRLSPYAAAVMLRRRGYDLCEKTIYNYIRRGLVPGVSTEQMAYRKGKKKERGKIKRLHRKKDCPGIDKRDASVLDRKDVGHWEMDTVYSGKDCSKSCLLVLTERKTRFEILVKMKDRTAASTVRALDRIERSTGRRNFRRIFKTLTCDNGIEFFDYEGITKRNRTKLYYCHPFCSCERASNENQNKLVRRWIPKGDDIGLYSVKDIKEIQDWINTLPRKMFKGFSALDMISGVL